MLFNVVFGSRQVSVERPTVAQFVAASTVMFFFAGFSVRARPGV